MINPDIQHIAILYILCVNMVSFTIFGIDKWKATHARRRIPEITLLTLAALGGSIGAWLGMYVWRHKTKHLKFRLGIPVIIVLQITAFLLMSCKTNATSAHPVLNSNENVGEHSPSVFIVTFDPTVGKEPLLAAIKEYGAEIVYDYKIISGMAIKKPARKSLEETMRHFRSVKGVLSVEYDRVYHLTDPVKPRLEVK